MTDSTRFMTIQEVAELLRTPAETVRYWNHVNKGPKSFKVGRRRLYAREDVEAFVRESNGAEAPPEQRPPMVDQIDYARLAEAVARVQIPSDSPGKEARTTYVPRAEFVESIARLIEAQAEFEGPRAQRVIRMCAEVVRSHGRGGRP